MAVIDHPRQRQRPRLDVHPVGALAAATSGAVLGICVADQGAAILRTALLVIAVALLAVGALRLLAR